MAKTTGLGERLFVSQYDLSGDVGAISSIGWTQAQQDVTTLRDGAMARLGLLKDGTLSYTAFFDVAAGQEHLALRSVPQSAPCTWATGVTVGSPAGSLNANYTDYGLQRGQDGSLVASPTAQASGSAVEWGVLLTTGAQTFAGAAAGTGVDDYVPIFGTLPLPSTYGLVAYLHALSIGSGTAAVHLQDSTDNVTFADITGGAFTDVTAATSQRLVVTGSIRRYLRVNVSGTFTNLDCVVSAARVITSA